jgi:hypothetical protein
VALGCTVGCLWLLRWGQTHGAAQQTEELLHRLSYLLIGVVLSLIGAFLVARRGDNLVSWIALGAGLSLSLAAFVEQYSHLAAAQPGDWPAGILALWLAQWAWMLPYISLVLLLLYYPTGRLLTPRWRWVVRLSLLGYLTLGTWLAFGATLDIGDPAIGVNEIANPIGFLPSPAGNASIGAFIFVMISTLLASLFGLGLRFHRARGIEREQMKWLLFAGALFVASMPLDFFSVPYSGVITNVVSLSIPAAIAVAILRYRLFDIDVIIRRTTTYALITGLLALVYFASIVVLQSVFGRLTNFDSTPAVVLSTLLIAALFLPVRRRVQDLIDRRFNRTRYDAEKTLERFAATARDETDLDALLAEVQRVIQETMQPESVSVWLRETERTTPFHQTHSEQTREALAAWEEERASYANGHPAPR